MERKELSESRFQEIFGYNAKNGLNEATFLGNNVMTSEEGDDDNNTSAPDGGAEGGTPAPGGDMGGGAPMGGDPNAMGGAPAPGGDMGGGAPMGGDPNAMGGTPAPDGGMGGDPNAGGAAGPEGFDPQIDMSGAPEDLSGAEQPDDEVVDITDLTDKQDDIDSKIDKIQGELKVFADAFKNLGAFEEIIKANNAKIENLQAEFEKRNPTQVEKLSMQTAKSGPFNVTPKEFWDEKEATSNYSTDYDNNGKDQGQYTITAKDVNGDTNWNGIAKSLDDEDWMFGQSLDKVAKF